MVINVSGNIWTEGGLKAALRQCLLRGQTPSEEVEMALACLGTRGQNIRLHVVHDVQTKRAKAAPKRRRKKTTGRGRGGDPGTGLSRFRCKGNAA